jgi:type I restriction-modification system DNA methylase subunit
MHIGDIRSKVDAFHGFDFDNSMLRIGSRNMLLHGVENPDIRYSDSLAQDHAGEHAKNNLPEVLEKWRKWNVERRNDGIIPKTAHIKPDEM